MMLSNMPMVNDVQRRIMLGIILLGLYLVKSVSESVSRLPILWCCDPHMQQMALLWKKLLSTKTGKKRPVTFGLDLYQIGI